MIIYKLTMNKVNETLGPIHSSYVSPRDLVKLEYYKTKELAEKAKNEYYEALFKLLGLKNNHEIIITEIEVIE